MTDWGEPNPCGKCGRPFDPGAFVVDHNSPTGVVCFDCLGMKEKPPTDAPQTGSGPFPMPRPRVDTAKMRALDHCGTGCDCIHCSAADEIDELRDVIHVARRTIATEFAAHEQTKRALESAISPAIHDLLREQLLSERCAHEQTKRELETMREFEQRMRERLQSAEDALGEYTGLDTRLSHIAKDHFARYRGGNG